MESDFPKGMPPKGQYARGIPSTVNLIELIIKVSGLFVLLHDGSQKREDSLGSYVQPTFFTKEYGLALDGKLTGVKLTLRYDLRTNWADITWQKDSLATMDKELSRIVKEKKDVIDSLIGGSLYSGGAAPNGHNDANQTRKE